MTQKIPYKGYSVTGRARLTRTCTGGAYLATFFPVARRLTGATNYAWSSARTGGRREGWISGPYWAIRSYT